MLKIFAAIVLTLAVGDLCQPNAHAAIPEQERDALIALYNSTNGANWSVKTGWLGDAGTECSWYGVQCDGGNTGVISLVLSSNNLIGSIPPELGNLANLQYLYLNSNHLSGSILAQLGDLANLAELDLGSNTLSGNIPSQIGNLSALSYLNLSYNALYATGNDLISFLNSKEPGWQNTQTIAPEDISSSAWTDSIFLWWSPTLYISDSGKYEIYMGIISGGPYELAGSIASKLETSLRITGLRAATKYYFAIRTVTYSHYNNQNTVYSEFVEFSDSTLAGEYSIILPMDPGGTTSFHTAGYGDVPQVGYANLSVESGDTPYATAVFSYKQDDITVSEAGVPASPPTTQARIFIDYRTDVNSIPSNSEAGAIDVNTGIAVVNCSSQAAYIFYTLRDIRGYYITSGTELIPGYSHFSRFISEFHATVDGFALPADFQTDIQFATLEIESDQPLSILALRMTTNQRDEVLYTTTPVADLTQSPATDPIYFAQFADGGGYTSSLILMNTSDETQTGALEIMDSEGNPLTINRVGGASDSYFWYRIYPGGYFLLRTDGSPTSVKTGWVRLTPDEGSLTPASSGLFGYNKGGALISESGVPAALSTTHARVYVDLTGNHNTGLAIANMVATLENIEINAFQKDGITAIGTSMGPLELSGYGHAAKFADQFIAGLPAGFTGVLDISSTTPFAALTIRSLDNERGDFIFTTFPVADMTRPAPSLIIFPQIADGGGYVSEFILLGSTGASTSTLSFYDNSGDPLEFEN